MTRVPLLVAALALLIGAARPPMTFEASAPDYAAGAAEYERIWRADGARIVAALEAATGLRFPASPIEALVYKGPGMATYDGRTLRLRVNASPDYKRATLVHELGHVLTFTLRRNGGLDDHRLLYLFLYDVWAELYGRDFADRMVAIERRIPNHYDYDAAWTWAMQQGRDRRQARLRELRIASGLPAPGDAPAPALAETDADWLVELAASAAAAAPPPLDAEAGPPSEASAGLAVGGPFEPLGDFRLDEIPAADSASRCLLTDACSPELEAQPESRR